ncbi:uncharacterized protein LOC115783994 [Archocentrus centrarchus]|uniref:uncharacterized protein LOC115783994 n=1 Tax=Archocentrus centrarchus TaxID=63155 RepID=UPI0011E9CD1D|nr:uncharacterized protein LOC115783994 [Archocentrus centrarchus]
MQRAYEFILTKGSSTPVQPDIPTEQQCVEPRNAAEEQPEMTTKEHCANEHPETLTDKQAETITEEDPTMLSDELAESIFVLNLVPVSPSSPCSQSFQKKKRERSTSPTISTTSPQHVTATDRPSLQSFHPPACRDISQSLSQGGPSAKKGRKGCRKYSRQKIFKFEAITGNRINEGKAELKVPWVPCSFCGKIWDDTWEPASQFHHHFAVSEVPPPSASEQLSG